MIANCSEYVNSSEGLRGPNTDQELPFPLIAPCKIKVPKADTAELSNIRVLSQQPGKGPPGVIWGSEEMCDHLSHCHLKRPRAFLTGAYPVARPSLQASSTTVTEHEGPVVLTCLTDETGVSIRWFFEGQSLLLTRGMTLSLDNSTLTIDPVSRKDAGDYQCEVSNRANSRKSDPHRLSVTCE
ncbi:hypothetical protein FD754_023486 [Muntiacus muntjak]|uniref:Ig-like domain-containing protein n=1 Tax=Muntiacus muntjak TaxID=9888 RepID=A0A5N3UTB5_MUNMU|nr:hypothetical protein FD754_023486 [Muntiacus muntjak]